MISLPVLTAILILHYVGDYLLQSRWMANNKSKHLAPLTAHIIVYMTVIWIGSGFWMGMVASLKFASCNGALHWWTDYFTSRVIARLWEEKRPYETFAVMGLDQLIHTFTLFVTYEIITR